MSSVGAKRARAIMSAGDASDSRRAGMGRSPKQFPYGTYSRQYFERGTPSSIAAFGDTFRSATAEQKAARKKVGYVGRGEYR